MKKIERKRKRFSITLSDKEGAVLMRYANDHGISRPNALKNIVKQALKEYKKSLTENVPSHPQNQLGLFDSIQLDIFNNPSNVEK